MLSRLSFAVLVAGLLSSTPAQAQSARGLGGPVNYPPADFSGQQFVDNRGCVFLKAGYGGTVNWVPRVTADRSALCGQPPTFGTMTAATVEAEMQSGAPVVLAAPAQRAPMAVAQPTAVAAPVAAAPAAPRRAMSGNRYAQPAQSAPIPLVPVARPAPQNAIPTPPRGYRLAWDDDRLNPLRGVGTAAGQAQQDQVWTRDIPAKLVTAPPAAAVTYAPTRTTVSTMSAPTRAAAQSYVQVGTFGQPANAAGVTSRLSALGLPVATGKITRQGKVLQVVYAGPFATPAEARSALATTRNAGFSDAILK